MALALLCLGGLLGPAVCGRLGSRLGRGGGGRLCFCLGRLFLLDRGGGRMVKGCVLLHRAGFRHNGHGQIPQLRG